METTRTGAVVQRVTDTLTGHQLTVTAEEAAATPQRYTPAKSPAVDSNGLPRPPKTGTPTKAPKPEEKP